MRTATVNLLVAFAPMCAAQPGSVVDSPHNLSAIGPGRVRALSEDQVCIFCHAPHNASPIRPLWNRLMPVEAYSIYNSRALDAEPGQPTGTSKMCLSCHDGTIALGSVVSRDTPILMAGGMTRLPSGASNLGTDLSDDHPISFTFDAALVGKDPHIRHPSALPPEVRLDDNGELQCTSCHDAHNNSRGDFLVMHNFNSELCVSCHQVGTTTVGGHAQCSACHQPHTAPSGPYLLKRQNISETCLACHDGAHPPAENVVRDMHKVSVHDTASPVDPPGHFTEHATCADCHDPHTMKTGFSPAPTIHPNFGDVPGMNSSGAFIPKANYEFEVCFRCHADDNSLRPLVGRVLVQNNTRLEFAPGAVSYHPVMAPGRNTFVPSLKPGWTVASVMHCSHCHGSDTGLGLESDRPHGVHGSNAAPLLAARYETADYTPESSVAYALCYQCHDRASILSNESFPGHRLHIVEQRTSCATCHDAHGIASAQGTATANSNLINFATATVFPDPVTGRLEFRDMGTFSGQCFLSCHGKPHSPLRYP